MSDLELKITITRTVKREELENLIFGTGALTLPWWHSVQNRGYGTYDFRFDDPEGEEGTFTGQRLVTDDQIVAAASAYLSEGRGGEDAREAISEDLGYLDANAADCILQRAVLGSEVYG